ncbi:MULTISPECIES: hypothetical protein [Streptosporangium]|uniref:Uncharacterized protein n=1 Tax=Streptosporangium jomthongense TaxID=1193683 RepID=A0ABV8F647_9ACTN
MTGQARDTSEEKKRTWRYRQMFVLGAALLLTTGDHMTDRDDPGKARQSVVTPAGKDDTSNAKVIDKDQLVEIDENSPLWPLFEGLPYGDSTATDSKKE